MADKKKDNETKEDKTYFEVMLDIEKRIWDCNNIKKQKRKKKINTETSEIQKKMYTILNKLKLTYQVKYVSIYLMILFRNNWDSILEKIPKSMLKLKSKEYINNILILSCIFISSNYEELNPPSYNALIKIVEEYGFKLTNKENKITRKHVHIFEKLIWELTGFQVEIPSANSFLMQLIKYSKLPKEYIFKVSKISNDVINHSLGTEIIHEYRQSFIAISSYLLAIKLTFKNQTEKQSEYTNEIVKYADYSLNNLIILRNKLEQIYV
ncbi:cyclin possible cyclin A [Cryptosporidium bovis]|uniref:cyclin possible cyclin A n=1 Tax=Cryptosporidium bovis TaxID=310047 RepID=UPI00351A1067|nr:cyclin possible cyclin A [Cryptosporidium bovis]